MVGEPKTVRKRQRRLEGVDAMVLSLTVKGLTTGEVQAHLVEVYGTEVSRETISKITDAVLEEMNEWLVRPLDRVYPVIFIDAIHVKVRDGQVANRAFYCAIGVTVDGKRDILGIWPSPGGEGAKFWLSVLTELRNRGVADACIVCCDGLKGPPDAIAATWPDAIVQTCVLHLIRNTFRFAARQHWDAMARDLRPVYTAVNETEARARLDEFYDAWAERYPAIRTLWDNAWPRVRALPRLQRRDPPRHLLDQRHREPPRPDAESDPSERALPERAGRDEVPLPCRQVPRPDRPRLRALDEPLEASTQRLRRHVRRPTVPASPMTTRQRQLHH